MVSQLGKKENKSYFFSSNPLKKKKSTSMRPFISPCDAHSQVDRGILGVSVGKPQGSLVLLPLCLASTPVHSSGSPRVKSGFGVLRVLH